MKVTVKKIVERALKMKRKGLVKNIEKNLKS